MSHEATTWAFKQTGLKPSTKIVLLGLANCHNPHQGCFPSKKRLAEDCEMSERSVADHLKKLEEKGLIVVQESGGKRRGQFTSNRYILGFESDFCRGKELPSAKSAVGRIERSPSAKSAVGRRQNLPSNLVREPCKEPVRTDQPQTDPFDHAIAEDDDPPPTFSDFWDAWPLAKQGKQKAQAAFGRLSVDNRRLAVVRCRVWAERWRAAHPQASDLHPTTYLNGRRWEDEFSQAARPHSQQTTRTVPRDNWRPGATMAPPAPPPPPKRTTQS